MADRFMLDENWRLLNASIQEILNRDDDLPDDIQGIVNLATSDYNTFLINLISFGEAFGVGHGQRNTVLENLAPWLMVLSILPSIDDEDPDNHHYCKLYADHVYHRFRSALATYANWFLSKADEYRRGVAARGAEDEI